jgi:tRNA pseudouridine38-40 synthase
LRYFLKLSYKGTNYHGWQEQPNAVSVQSTIEKALSLILRYPTKIAGAGRTDAGVHASQMYAHFDTENEIDTTQIRQKLNSFLPKDIAIARILPVTDDAHARFDALARSYVYKIHLKKNPFLTDLSWFMHKSLDVGLMNTAAKALLFFDDFQSFSKTHTDVKTFICRVDHAEWIKQGDELTFHITADRFLRNMVRAIVGTLIDVGLHKISVDDFTKIIEAKNRQKAGFSVPAKGLYLSEIVYPKEIFI